MTSPRPPVLLKGAHSAPTITLRRSWSARSTRELRARALVLGLESAIGAARLKEGAKDERPRVACPESGRWRTWWRVRGGARR